MNKYLSLSIPLVMLGFTGTLVALTLAHNKNDQKKQGTVEYYTAVKQLKTKVLEEQTRQLDKTLISTQLALWLKLKKEIIDKELRTQAFIKDGNLVVSSEELDSLANKLTKRVKELAQSQGKKSDRMVSLDQAQSRIRDLLRRHGYQNQKQISSILNDALPTIEKEAASSRIALSKLEELTVAAIKRFKDKTKSSGTKRLSRLAAEVQVLKAIKMAKPSLTQEIAASTKMMDVLNKQASRDYISQEFVDNLIKEEVAKITQGKPKKNVRKKPAPASKAEKKEQKRGKDSSYGRGRWGNLKRPRASLVN